MSLTSPNAPVLQGISTYPDLYRVVAFVACLIPVAIGGISVNYLFVLLPPLLLRTSSLRLPPTWICVAILYYWLIFVVATITQVEQLDMFHRRVISFGLFMSIFVLSVFQLNERDVGNFKLAVVTVGVMLSLFSLIIFISESAKGPLGYEAKDLVGSQRVGFLYVVAFWLLLLEGRRLGRWIQLIGLALVLTGLFLTFSRSSLVALAASAVLYVSLSVLVGTKANPIS